MLSIIHIHRSSNEVPVILVAFEWNLNFLSADFRKILKYKISYSPSMGESDWLRAGRSGDRIPVEARFSAPVQTGPGAHPASCTMDTGSFPGVKSGRGVTLTPSPPSSAVVKKG